MVPSRVRSIKVGKPLRGSWQNPRGLKKRGSFEVAKVRSRSCDSKADPCGLGGIAVRTFITAATARLADTPPPLAKARDSRVGDGKSCRDRCAGRVSC
jgi:hypothetical protein